MFGSQKTRRTTVADAVRLARTLPRAIRWIGRTLQQHAGQAQPVASFGYVRLARCYPPHRLASAKVVVLEQVPALPIERWGFAHLRDLGPTHAAGITFGQTFFVRQDAISEHLFFHEMVHVLQWQTLGFGRFGLLYGVGLLEAGYRQSPLEAMAYDLTARFDAGESPDAETRIRAQTLDYARRFRHRGMAQRLAWQAVRPLHPRGWPADPLTPTADAAPPP
jgi:hypothetical protein